MDPEERDAAILVRLREVMTYAYERSPFYRREVGCRGRRDPEIRSLADYERVPVITKEELRLAQAEHPPLGDYLVHPRERGGTDPRHLGHHRPPHRLRHRPG